MASILLRIFASMFKNDGRNRTHTHKKTVGKKEVGKRSLLKVLLNLPSHFI